ncbi:uncharacterized protein BYT42DRAFT_65377 [Radiomyces spectabilis]|uniref:uncharacterized protein n=1 Tax=Radiomyces spectabilis TaxID=64574 RepID=UPI00221E6DC4|nr:uncharacterized protein BYT42DRAFT_65377 [Radiomyces spectabilis]KAI8371362.1 hypothetical protein BYT42DRAFT_65377 [Radiomyces spectabilis]
MSSVQNPPRFYDTSSSRANAELESLMDTSATSQRRVDTTIQELSLMPEIQRKDLLLYVKRFWETWRTVTNDPSKSFGTEAKRKQFYKIVIQTPYSLPEMTGNASPHPLFWELSKTTHRKNRTSLLYMNDDQSKKGKKTGQRFRVGESCVQIYSGH